jgi:succinate dehydrogenase / fumarate reductase flavoprotein subunit
LQKLEVLKSRNFILGEKSPFYYYENRSLLLTAEAVLRAALLRDESRGPHLRFAHYEDNIPMDRKEVIWEKYIVVHRENAGMHLEIREPALK